jgi:hypothetical protein
MESLHGVVDRRLQAVEVENEARVADRDDVAWSQFEVVRLCAGRSEIRNAYRGAAELLGDER